MALTKTEKIIESLNANWIWVSDWTDSSTENTAGRIVTFERSFFIADAAPTEANLNFTADTRYKLYVNDTLLAVGPSRSNLAIWYYDTLNIASSLRQGSNVIRFEVVRYFASSRAAMPFERTQTPGLTVSGSATENGKIVEDLSTNESWEAKVDGSTNFPTGLIDDVFLHISERVQPVTDMSEVKTVSYRLKSLNGEVTPWRLRPRCIPMPESNPISVSTIRNCESNIAKNQWASLLACSSPILLEARTNHVVDIQADCHSTAFVKWTFKANEKTSIRLKVTYSEGYELEPRDYPYFRTKADRLDAENGHIIGPFDDVKLDILSDQQTSYEPFWFRTFRLMRWDITVGPQAVSLQSFEATQTNYPLNVKAQWKEPHDAHAEDIWDVSLRTMRNCMFDGYSDCSFYEQLSYSCDSRSVGLFHYLLSGDDRLMRQTITTFAASITADGLTQSRFPSHVPQIIAGFSLYWILQVSDHHLYFGDTAYTRSFLPRIDGVLEYFAAHVDSRGLISGLPSEVWQYVDWVTTWGASDTHPDKGVPTSGRENNLHTYFSMLYAYVLKGAASLTRAVGRPAHAEEYEARAANVIEAVRTHCYDETYFTDSLKSIAGTDAYSQHCQVFAVLSGCALPSTSTRILQDSFHDSRFSKCSYMMRFYALRAFSLAGDEAYETFYSTVWDPYKVMLKNNLTTWEEDDVRQRSDCHAWGSVPIYEFCVEVAGIQPIAPGCKKILWKPRLRLSKEIHAKIALGRDNVATVSWTTDEDGKQHVNLSLEKEAEVISQMPGAPEQDHGVTRYLSMSWSI